MSRYGYRSLWLTSAWLVVSTSHAQAPPLKRRVQLEPGVAQVEARRPSEPDAPPWVDEGDVPVPAWATSVAPTKPDAAFYADPSQAASRRGSAQWGARLPLFATKRGPGCLGRWLNVGPFAWICSDVAAYSEDAVSSPPLGARPWMLPGGDGIRPSRPGARELPPIEPTSPTDDGLPYRYFFAGPQGAFGYANLDNAEGGGAPDQELEQGFAVAIVEETTANGEAWGKTKKGRWIAMRELVSARAFLFHGELVTDGKLDVAWVLSPKANVYAAPKPEKVVATRVRFEKVRVVEESGTGATAMVRIVVALTEGVGSGVESGWMRARDLSRAQLAAPPVEAEGAGAPARWLDIDLAQQTLVAYEGAKPLFATLVSTGKGPPKSEFGTHLGVHRIWVKIVTTKMDNLDKEDAERHYAIEDVPWVQFFDKAIALHGVFWHRDFGHVHSHGCVNLAPIDARWLYAFTAPHLPIGWAAVYPTKVELGTVVRIR